eukprot:199097_1
MAEEKLPELEINGDDSGDEEAESVVNNTDLRDKAYNLMYKGSRIYKELKNTNIIDCIGRVTSSFTNQYNKNFQIYGTATAYRTENGITNLITCAHNVRYTSHHCKSCKKYHKAVICPKCQQNSETEILKAHKVEFEIRNLKTGEQEAKYECMDDIYLDDFNFSCYPKPSGTFDIAVLKVYDYNGYFAEKTKNILLVSGYLLHKVKPSEMKYYIFGYPYSVKIEKEKEMWGAASIDHENKYELIQNRKNDNWYLKQHEIDTSEGQSGAPIFSIYKKYALIFAVHVGGNDKAQNTYNVGTLMQPQMESKELNIQNLEDLIKHRQQQPFDMPNLEVEWDDDIKIEIKSPTSKHENHKNIENESQLDKKENVELVEHDNIMTMFVYADNSVSGSFKSFILTMWGVCQASATGIASIPVVAPVVAIGMIGLTQQTYTMWENYKISNHNDKSDKFNAKLELLKKNEEVLIPKAKELKKQEEKINDKTFQIERLTQCSDCSKVVVCIGPTGYGKSLLCNRLIGYGEDKGINHLSKSKEAVFNVGNGANSETKDLVQKTKNVFISDKKTSKTLIRIRLSVVDTPGAFDSNDDDSYYQNCMKEFFRECSGINVFCIFFQFGTVMNSNYKRLLKMYTDFWGNSFWKHCVIVITHCDIDSDRLKEKLEDDRKSVTDTINAELAEIAGDLCKNIPIFEFGAKNFKKSRIDLLLKLHTEYKNKYKCDALESPMDKLWKEIQVLDKERN